MPPQNQAPIGSLKLVTPMPIRVGQMFAVDVSGSYDPDGPNHKIKNVIVWGEGDAKYSFTGQASTPIPFGGYADTGPHDITLKLTDHKGREGGAKLTIDVQPAVVEPPPVDPPPVDPDLVPAECRTTWAPGVKGGIPSRTTIYTTIYADHFGNGTVEASEYIRSQILACPPEQTVLLSAGTFQINDYVLLDKDITLRGAGPGQTLLRKTNGAVEGSHLSDEQEPLVIIGPERWPKLDAPTNLTADGVKGSMSVVVQDATAFTAGDFALLDEDHYATGAWRDLPPRNGQPHDVKIWASDRIVFPPYTPGYVEGEPFPPELTWFSRPGRPLNEIKEIASVSGNTITFTTPLHTDYHLAQAAQLTNYVHPHVRRAGLEDLTVSGGSDANVVFETAAECWLKNVDSTSWLGPGVAVNQSFRVEVRDSYLHDGVHPYPGGGGYCLSLSGGSAEVLIENNVVLNANKNMVVRSSGAGSVVGYNYMDNSFIGNYHEWVEVGINGSHMLGGHHILFEGNQSHNYDSDNTHGGAICMTVFRNHLVGRRRDFPGQVNGRCAGLMFGSWWHAFLGNVLGEDGQMDGWSFETWADKTIWKLGYDPSNWGQAADPKVLETVLRDGNFDYLTNTVKWDRDQQPLPASLYLTEKPAFFGAHPWPWVTPESETKLAVLPARLRAT